MNTHFIEALKDHLNAYEFGDELPWYDWVFCEIDKFVEAWPSNPDNPDNYPEVFHVRSYGDMTKEQFDEYISHQGTYDASKS